METGKNKEPILDEPKLPKAFIIARDSTSDNCAKCLARGDIDMVTGYVRCENPVSPNRQTSCSPGSSCSKYQA